MESGKYALQGTVVGNKIQTFLILRVSLKYGKQQGTMACRMEILQVAARYGTYNEEEDSKRNITSGMNI